MNDGEPWWLAKPYRMIQTNLREIDARLDVDEYFAQLKSFHAEIVLFNVGGIVANYPTELPFHFRNPHLKDDLVGKVLARAKREGIRFVARFDSSKVHESLAEKHPEWLYLGDRGRIDYNGQVHVCLNGAYQQERSLDILDEALARYAVDGVFFNMFGYHAWDYSGIYHGLCRCANCRSRFKAFAGAELPAREDPADPVFRRYDEFRRETTRELFQRIREAVRKRNAGLPVMTWADAGVDVYRSESNSGIDRSPPEWTYASTDNSRTAVGTWPGTAASNTAVHFIDFPYRHVGVSPALTRARLAGDLVAGGWVDWYVIGTLEGQEDRMAFPDAREVFSFHAAHERWLTGTAPLGDVVLVKPAASGDLGALAEYRGLFRILTEAHVLFDVVQDLALDRPDAADRLAGYRAVVVPDARRLSGRAAEALDACADGGGRLLVTGLTGTLDAAGDARPGLALRCLGVTAVGESHPRRPGSYLRVRPEDKRRLSGFAGLDLLHLDDVFLAVTPEPDAETFLRRIPPAMFGPPEKCYYGDATDEPGLVFRAAGRGRAVFMPWRPGAQYAKFAHPGLARIVVAALEDLLGLERRLTTGAPPNVEVALHREREGRWLWVGLVNHPGQLGTAHHAPLPVRDIELAVLTDIPVKEARSLRLGLNLPCAAAGGRTTVSLPQLDDFDVVVLES
jgi:hypothetical protein